jgi:integrase
MKLTKATIETLRLPPRKTDHIVFDETLPGFGIRLRAGGKRSWVAQYRLGGKTRRLSLGDARVVDAEEARRAAREKLAKATLGTDPAQDRALARVKSVTLINVIDRFLAAKAATWRPKSIDGGTRFLRTYWKALHAMPVDQITRRHVALRVAEMVDEHGPVAAARARSCLSTCLAWGMREGLVEQNAVIGSNAPPAPPSRDRVLSDDEIAKVWKACPADDYGHIVRLLILTGQRRDEVGGMAWSELDRDRGTWTLPGKRTKNKRLHQIALPPLAWQIIETVERQGRDHLFGQRDGYHGWTKAKVRLDRDTGAMAPWTLHDLRRSCATHMADLGIQPHVIEATLNHTSGHKAGVSGIYNRSSYKADVARALALWSDHVRSLVEGGSRRVLAFPPRS